MWPNPKRLSSFERLKTVGKRATLWDGALYLGLYIQYAFDTDIYVSGEQCLFNSASIKGCFHGGGVRIGVCAVAFLPANERHRKHRIGA